MNILMEFTNIDKSFVGLIEQAEHSLKELGIDFKIDYDRLKRSRIWLFKDKDLRNDSSKDIGVKIYLAENYGDDNTEILLVPMDMKMVNTDTIKNIDMSYLPDDESIDEITDIIRSNFGLNDEDFYKKITKLLKQYNVKIQEGDSELLNDIMNTNMNTDDYPPSLSEDLFFDKKENDNEFSDLFDESDEEDEEFDQDYEIRKQRLFNNISDFKQNNKSKPKLRDCVIEGLLDFIDDEDIDDFVNKIV